MGEYSEDYHDYVIKDGKLIGDFENMYKYSRDIPWHQDEVCKEWQGEVSRVILGKHAPYKSVLDIGSGLGYFMNEMTSLVHGSCMGVDVSPTAVKIASQLFPNNQFAVGDIADPSFELPSHFIQEPHLVMVREIFWYVCESLDIVLMNLSRILRLGSYLYVEQGWPNSSIDFYGKDILPNPDSLFSHIHKLCDPIREASLRNLYREREGSIVQFLGQKK